MSDKKRYLITAITLGAIAAASGALIGITNLITRGQIAQNEINKINAGIANIFGDNAKIAAEDDIKTGDYKYVTHYYKITNDENVAFGYALKTSGSNMYGKISLIVGFNESEHEFMGTYIVINEQTYATTLVDNYVTPLNEGERDLNDVSCGATYGAKLIRDMINEAKEAADELWKE